MGTEAAVITRINCTSIVGGKVYAAQCGWYEFYSMLLFAAFVDQPEGSVLDCLAPGSVMCCGKSLPAGESLTVYQQQLESLPAKLGC